MTKSLTVGEYRGRSPQDWYWIYSDGVVGKAHIVSSPSFDVTACRRVARPADGSDSLFVRTAARFTPAPPHAVCCKRCLAKHLHIGKVVPS